MTRPLSWQAIARQLAMQLSVHAFCGQHPADSPDAGCPFCADRAAYQLYLDKGGRDYRPVPPPGAVSIPLSEVADRWTGRGECDEYKPGGRSRAAPPGS